MSKLTEWVDCLESQVENNSIYVLGAQGEDFTTITPKWLESKEEPRRIGQIFGLLANKYTDGKSMKKAKCFDCSGLFVYFALMDKNKLLPYDMTADGIYRYTTEKHGKAIKLDELRCGDFVFQTSGNKSKHHIGYIVENGYVIEAKGRSAGVVKNKFDKKNWDSASRPDFWDYTIKRELKLVTPYTTGEDVREVQKLLAQKGYYNGQIDGCYGPVTANAVSNFQTGDKVGITLRKNFGVVNKKTALALGLGWEKLI